MGFAYALPILQKQTRVAWAEKRSPTSAPSSANAVGLCSPTYDISPLTLLLSRCPCRQFLWRHIFDMGSDKPVEAKRIGDDAAAITVKLIGDRPHQRSASLQCAVDHRIDIFHIQHQA